MTKITNLIHTFYFQLKAKYQDEFINSITYERMAVFNSYMTHNIRFKGWHAPLRTAIRNARYGKPASEHMVNALLEAGADTNSKYFNALGMALDNFLDHRGPGIVSYETYVREKTWQSEEPQKSQIKAMEEGAFRVLTNILSHGAVPTIHQQKTINQLREDNPYFDALLLEKDLDIANPKSQVQTPQRMRHKI